VDRLAQLSLLRQDFEHLLKLCEPEQVKDWKPTQEQRLAYAQLLERILNSVDAHRSAEKRDILREGTVQVDISDSAIAFFRGQLEPRLPALKDAYDTIDPDGAELYRLLEGIGALGGAGGGIRGTFEEGIQQIYNLIDRNPDLDFSFFPDIAYDVLDSKLIAFEPDSWLDRARQLAPIRTERRNVLLPVHVRMRLEELFRAYVFGCWLSVFALARAILEYAILDNLHKFGIDRFWPSGRDDKKREKKLEHLIDDVGGYLSPLREPMDRLRNYGNEYLHPKPSRTSKETLFNREKAAKDALETIVFVIESLYRATKRNA